MSAKQKSQIEQLELWVQGESVHTEICCPDFSCCRPELKASQEDRDLYFSAFKNGKNELCHEMEMGFLGKAIETICKEKGLESSSVYITDGAVHEA
jgi:hypothetical protein